MKAGVERRRKGHHPVPLSVELVVVARVQSVNLLVGLAAAGGGPVGSCLVAGGVKLVIELGIEEFAVHLVRAVHLEGQKLIKGRHILFRQAFHQPVHLVRELRILGKSPLCLGIIGKGEVGVHNVGEFLAVPLALPAHTLRLAAPGEAVVLIEDSLQCAFVLLAEDAGKPARLVGVHALLVKCVNVHRQLEESFHRQLRRLDVADIQQPVAVSPVPVCLHQLLVHQHWRCGIDPEIIVRCAKIRDVVIHAGASGPLLLLGVADALEVAVIVIRPDEGDVVRNLQTVIVDIESLLVRHEYLRNLFGRPVYMSGEDFPLVIDDLGDYLDLLVCRKVATQTGVVDSPHRCRVDVFIHSCFGYTGVKLAVDDLLVGLVVPVAVAFGVPFAL